MSKRKLQTLNLERKVNLIRDVEKNPNVKKKDLALKYGIPPNTLSTILKDKEIILKRHQSSVDPKCKRLKTCAFPDVEAALLKWFSYYRTKKSVIPLSGTMLREKALDFAKLLNVEGFTASTGWLEKFKARNNIVFRTLHGEAKDVPDKLCEEWKKETLTKLLEGYNANDVFNIDEMGLFYKCLPNKTMMFKGESCSGGKLSKERLTVLVGANASGTEKLPLLVIGKYKNPRCFKNAKSLPVQYKSNKKAWMTLILFEEYIRNLDSMFHAKKRKVLIFVDQCTAHGELLNLKSIKLEFLPSNTTSKLQPADQGIIKCLKHSYRKRLVKKAIDDNENGINKKCDVLEAIRLISSAWNSDVKQTIIKNCFNRCGFFANDTDPNGVSENPEDVNQFIDEDANTEFLNIDENVAICGELSDTDILEAIKGVENDAESEDDEEVNCVSPPSNQEAHAAITTLQQYLESRDGVDDSFPLFTKSERFPSL